MHPRTRERIDAGQRLAAAGLRLIDPLGYLDFLSLVEQAAGVLTDSGGVQEETTYLGVPCFTLRANTERPITIDRGTNELLGLDPTRILDVPGILAGRNGARSECRPGGTDMPPSASCGRSRRCTRSRRSPSATTQAPTDRSDRVSAWCKSPPDRPIRSRWPRQPLMVFAYARAPFPAA